MRAQGQRSPLDDAFLPPCRPSVIETIIALGMIPSMLVAGYDPGTSAWYYAACGSTYCHERMRSELADDPSPAELCHGYSP
jgi:hypothetical protein